MEWVSHIAGEHHSDAPVCVSPVLRHFGIALNDRMPDDWRQKLRPYLARMIGTANDGLDQQRLYLLADWAVRVILPMGLEARGRDAEAQRFRAMPPITNKQTAADAADAADAAWAADAANAARAARAADAADAADAAWAARAAEAAYAADAAWAAGAADAADAAWAAGAAEVAVWQSSLDILDRL